MVSGSSIQTLLCRLMAALMAWPLLGGLVLAEHPMFVIQETKHQLRPAVQDAHLDRTPPPKPAPQGPGIVGLDMLIHSQRYPVVQAVFWGTPAQQAGMRAGDTIVAVNGIQTLGKSRDEVDWMISDVPGEEIRFSIVRDAHMQEIRLKVMPVGALSAQQQQAYFAH